jgi:hypothetical protein
MYKARSYVRIELGKGQCIETEDNMNQKYISNIAYMNIAQLKSLHKIEHTRLVVMRQRQEEGRLPRKSLIDIQQFADALHHQEAIVKEFAEQIEKLENLNDLSKHFNNK